MMKNICITNNQILDQNLVSMGSNQNFIIENFQINNNVAYKAGLFFF